MHCCTFSMHNVFKLELRTLFFSVKGWYTFTRMRSINRTEPHAHNKRKKNRLQPDDGSAEISNEYVACTWGWLTKMVSAHYFISYLFGLDYEVIDEIALHGWSYQSVFLFNSHKHFKPITINPPRTTIDAYSELNSALPKHSAGIRFAWDH